MTIIASDYTDAYEESRNVGDDIYNGISRVGELVLPYLPLRKCRSTYASLRGFAPKIPDVPECYGNRIGEVSPMHMVKVRMGVVDKERNVYLPRVEFLSIHMVEQGIISRSRLQSAPWTIVFAHSYKERSGVYLGSLGYSDITGELARVARHMCRSPLSVYTLDAISDIQRYSSGDYHCIAYSKPSTVTISTGLIGVLHMNTLVNMNLDDDINRPDMALRDVTEEQMGFLCMGHTSHSEEAGSVRRLSRCVEIRLWKLLDWELVVERILECLKCESESDDNAEFPSPHLLMIEEMYRYVTPTCLGLLRTRFLDGLMRSATMRIAVVDLNGRELEPMHIEISPGALIRRRGAWAYDSVTVKYWEGVEQYLHISRKHFNTHMSTYFSSVPFLSYNRLPRTLISSVQALQAMCHPVLYTSLVHIPLNVFSPLVTTEFSKEVLGKSTYLIPGENVCILLMNLNDNYEGCFVLSDKCIKERLFSYREVATIAVDTDDQVKVGDISSMKTHTWRYIPFEATVKPVRSTLDTDYF
jgi:hypothetical protein